MLCVYNDTDRFKKCLDESIEDIAPVFEPKFRELKQYFDDNNDAPLKNRLNIILFLFPVMDKEDFVLQLHERLYHLQKV
jgi:hypothetical protein